jgi:hypothetical protein
VLKVYEKATERCRSSTVAVMFAFSSNNPHALVAEVQEEMLEQNVLKWMEPLEDHVRADSFDRSKVN